MNSDIEQASLAVLNSYLSTKPFFENCAQPIQSQYYEHLAEILTICPKDSVSIHYADLHMRPIHKEKLIFLKARMNDDKLGSISVSSMDEALEEAISLNSYSTVLRLLTCALQTIGTSYVINYINEHLFLLKKSISFLSLALELGIQSVSLDQYSTTWGDLAEYHLLCIEHKSLTDDEREELEKKALEAYRTHNELRGFKNITSLVIIARKHNEFDFLEPNFRQLPIAIHRSLAQYFYHNKDNDSAIYHIQRVMSSDSSIGDDYLLLGLISSGDESIAAFQTGYQSYQSTACLFNLLITEYQHNSIKQETLLAASRVDTSKMQSLVSSSYYALGNIPSAFSHCIRALLLTKDYDAQIYNQAFQLLISHKQDQEQVPANVGMETCVFLEDADQARQYICFYPLSSMVPHNDCYWCNIRHIWADYSNEVYASLVTRPIGSTVTLSEKQFRIVGLSKTYDFISKHCLDNLVSHNDVLALSGDISITIESIKELLSDRAKHINDCLEQYQDSQSLPITSLRGLANRFGAYRFIVVLTSECPAMVCNVLISRCAAAIVMYTSPIGRTVHYDEHGRKVGITYQSSSGRLTHYDANGRRTGTSYRSSSGRLTHYDSDGRRTGASYTSAAGVVCHYDSNGHKTGTAYSSSAGVRTTYPNESRTSASSSNQNDDASGCLIAIAVFIAIVFLIT